MVEKIFHMHAKIFSRGKGDNFFQKLAYRDGNRYEDELTGRTFDYQYKKKKENIESILMTPEHAAPELKNRESYYQELAKKEKAKNAQFFREFEFSLYNELTPNENKELAQRFGQKLVDRGMIVDLNFHKLDSHNPHCHALISMRGLNDKGKFGNKNRAWNDRNLYKDFRKDYADLANAMFKEKGLDYQVSEKSYRERGIDKTPQKHMPVKKKKDARYEDLLEFNKLVKKDNKRNELQSEKRAIMHEKKEEHMLSDITKTLLLKPVTTLENKKEVKRMEKRKTSHLSDQFLEDFEHSQHQEQPEPMMTRAERKAKEMAVQTTKTVGSLLHDQVKRLTDKSKELTKSIKHSKTRVREEKIKLRDKRELFLDTRYDRKQKIKDLKLDNKFIKNDLKNTKRLSIHGLRKRSKLRHELKKNELAMKRQKLGMRREKEKYKRQEKNYRQERITTYKLMAEKAKTYAQVNKLNKQIKRTQNIELPKNVVSIDQLRRSKEKAKVTKNTLERSKSRDKTL